MSIISTTQTVRGQPSSRFHVEAWLPFRNCEMVHYGIFKFSVPLENDLEKPKRCAVLSII